jgi:CO/xanthine dehydrogenase Mo-binding subunit
MAPAAANALYNAIGVKFNNIPITPEQVLKALKRNKHKE